jgi:hypothetical protein
LSSRRSTGTPSGAAGDRESAWAGSTRSVIAAFPSRFTGVMIAAWGRTG